MAEAVHELDYEVGKLEAGIQQLNLRVDVVVLADHGMVRVEGPTIYLDQYGLKQEWFERIVGTALYPRSDADAQKAYQALKGKSEKFEVYRRAQVPAELHFDGNAREGDPVIVPTGPYYIAFARDPLKPDTPPAGAHGYDARRMREMNAIFFAAGPDIRSGVSLPPFESVDVYPLVAKLLGLEIGNLKTGPIDGKPEVLEGALKNTK